MITKKAIVLVMATIATVVWAWNISAFETDTHTLLSLKATDASQLNIFLTTMLGFEFPQGTAQEIGQGEFKKVSELIANVGAVNEDKPEIRARTHFHDPTKAWAQAGLTSPFTGTFQSSTLWSQNTSQDWGGKHSWQDARNSYFNALTATDAADRKRFYAETFESLGHLIHLVQDAATPAHTRNDWHLGFTTGNELFAFLNVDRFHQWAKTQGRPAINAAASRPFDPSILNQTYDGLMPIAGIIDTTTTAGPAIPSDATNIGIAEYSNANFFSDDTILKDYAYPNATQLDLTEEPSPDGPDTRFYLRKSFGPGPIGYRAAVSTLLQPFLPSGFPTQQWDLDDNVMSDYGALLFPRAIGYSAGLIEYFFRATIVCGGSLAPGIYHVDVFEIGGANGSEAAGQGEVELVNWYKLNGQVYSVSSPPVSVDFSNLPTGIDFSAWDSPPMDADQSGAPGPVLVFKGRLGDEDQAVAFGPCPAPG